MTKHILIEPIGSIPFTKSNRAKHLKIHATPKNGIVVTIPIDVSYSQAEYFAKQNLTWMKKKLAKMQKLDQLNVDATQNLPRVTKDEAKKKLIKRCWELSQKFSLLYVSVRIRNQLTLWGSCSARNTISLNSKLARLPQKMIDYVILHELIHTKHKNHGRLFWRDLTDVCPDSRSLDKSLKAYHIEYL